MKPISKEDVTIVLPALNEEEGIGLVIDELKSEGYTRILVVDGYSTDRTVEVAEGKGVKVVYQNGVGKAGAIETALSLVDTPYMLVMDADHSYDPRDIEKLLSRGSAFDQVIGYRSDRQNISRLHRVGNWVISLVLSLLLGRRLNDPCSGMYLLRTESVKALDLTSREFDVEVEIVTQLSTFGSIAEVPISYRKRVGKRKLQSWKDGFKILTSAFKLVWLYNPIFLVSAPISLLAFLGGIILIWQLYLRYVYGEAKWSLGWSWLGLTLLVTGLQAFTIATISLILRRMERRMIQTISRQQAYR